MSQETESMSDGNAAGENAELRAPATVETRRRIHWKTATGIVLVGGILQTVFWVRFQDDATYWVFSSLISVVSLFLLFLWWSFISGFTRKTRMIGVGLLAMTTGIFFSVYRVDGFWGQMLPIFKPRWEPTPEKTLSKFLATQASIPAGAGRKATAFGYTSSLITQRPKLLPDGVDNHDIKLAIAADDWPGFRGPRRDGIVTGWQMRRDWNENAPRQIWRHPVGRGWSSFAVVGERIFTQEQRGNEEVVVCYHAQTGRQLWVHADRARFVELMGGVGPRATPTLFDSRLYTLGATGILNCLNAITGEPLWPRSVNILKDPGTHNLDWAMAASPLVYDDLVVVNAGGQQGQGVIAYDRFSGNIRWATGNDPASYCAPRLETINGVRQILIFDGFGLKGHDAVTGDELWRTREWTNDPKVNAVQPIVRDGNRIFIASGYGVGCGLFKIMFAGGSWSVREEYVRPNRFKLKFNDAVYYDNHLYGLDEGILACHNFDTGQRAWKRGRYGYGQLLLVDDVLLIQAESGEVALVEANPNAFRELARFQAIDGKTWNHPVLHRGRLFVRNGQEAACYDLRPRPTTDSSKVIE